MTPPLGLKSGLWPKGDQLPTQLFALLMQFAIGFIEIGGFFHRRWGGAIAGPQRWNHATTGNPDALIRCEAIQRNQSSMALIDHVQIGINYFLMSSSSQCQTHLRACPKRAVQCERNSTGRPQASPGNGRQPQPYDFRCHQLVVRTTKRQLPYPDGQRQ